MAAVWLIALPGPFAGLSAYLAFHTIIEIVTVAVAAMIFALGWNADSAERPGNVILLSCAFLAGGVIDLGHLLSYQGMPDFVTPADAQKAIYFWLAKQLIVGSAFLVAVWLPWRPFASFRTQYVLLAVSLALTVSVYWVVLFHQDSLPVVFVPGHGLTSFKIGAEYLVIILNLATFALVLHRLPRLRPRLGTNLLLATGITVLAEVCFTLYADVTDAYSFLGHVYLVLAYIFVYRAVLVDSVKEPIERLSQSRDALFQSEGRFRGLVESNSEQIWEVNADLVITYVSRNSWEFLGYATEEVVGRKIFDFMSPEEGLRFAAVAEQILASQDPFSYLEFKQLHRDGHEVVLEASGAPFYHGAGKLLGYRGVTREITERKRTEQRLQQWAQIFEHAQWGVAVIDNQGRLQLMNSAYARMHGWSVAELTGRPVAEVIAPVDQAALGDHANAAPFAVNGLKHGVDDPLRS